MGWIVKDSVTSQLWDLATDGGEFYINPHTVNDPAMRNPVIKDTSTATYWQLSVANGLITWTPVVATSGDSVYMYDATLKQWWVIIMTQGIFGINTTSAPGGSHGFYPLEHYYKYLKGGKNVKYLLMVSGEKSTDIHKSIKVSADKRFTDSTLLKISGDKTVERVSVVGVSATKHIDTGAVGLVEGEKSFNTSHLVEASAHKELPMRESISVNGKKDLTEILMALDLI